MGSQIASIHNLAFYLWLMGEARKEALRVGFDSRIKLEFHGAAVTSDAGLVVYRELDEVLELTQLGKGLRDSRRGKNTQHELVRLLLRNGNVASADNWSLVLEPVIARYRDLEISKYFFRNQIFILW